jgi:hypothetical protein
MTGQGSQLQVGQGRIQDLQAGTVASPVGGVQKADVFYSQKKVFGEAVPSNNLVNGTVTTTAPGVTRTVTTENLSGFIPGGLGPMTLEQQLDYLRNQRAGLAGQSRPQPSLNNMGINFPTPGASF